MSRFLSSVGARPWLTGLLAFIGLAVASGAWAISTPLGASPDEPSHIIKAASVVRGQFIGDPTDQPATTRVTVPGNLADARKWPCYAFQQNRPASCQGTFATGPDQTAETSAGLYNPVYYTLVGWPSLLTDNAKAAVFGMRTVSAILCSAFLALGFVALRRLGIPFFAGIVTFAVATPMVLFLNASVNPNGLEIASGIALLSVLLALVRGTGSEGRGLLLTLTVISAAILANMRGLSPLWVGIIGVIALVGARPGRLPELLRRPSTWVALAGIVVTTGFALAWILATNTLNAMGTYPGAGTTPWYYAFVTMVLNRSIDPGFVGVFGWLDTFPPGYVVAVWGAIAGGVVLVALVLARGRLLAAFVVSAAALVLVPAVTQAGSVMHSGYIWQGRYALVAYACVVIVGGLVLAEKFDGAVLASGFLRRSVWTVAVVVASAQLLALAFTIKRYSLGADVEWITFLRHPGWLPPGGALIWLIALVVGLAVVGLGWRAATLAGRARDAATVEGQSDGRGTAVTSERTAGDDDETFRAKPLATDALTAR
ncbi:DUF2142 domain-containing protein [Leifsonia sp. McL0607]|uniref:DUF2142 domain-containing protein n=1 Tax=Leifsonia sp. McL0607 TaxID=3415672 RepID=UPI003CF9AAE3